MAGKIATGVTTACGETTLQDNINDDDDDDLR